MAAGLNLYGSLSNMNTGIAASTDALEEAGNSFGDALRSSDFTKRAGAASIIGQTGQAVSSAADPEGVTPVGGLVGGASQGAALGLTIGGGAIGTVVGGVLGGISGLFGSAGRRKAKEAEAKANSLNIMGSAMSKLGDSLANQQFRFGSGGGSFSSGRRLKL